MAKTSAIYRNIHRKELTAKFDSRRQKLKSIVMSKTSAPEDRFAAVLKLAELPRNSAGTRVRNRCALTGRPRGYYRKFNMSRIAIRELASRGMLPGVTKSSW